MKCPECDGDGDFRWTFGNFENIVDCARCDGTGEINEPKDPLRKALEKLVEEMRGECHGWIVANSPQAVTLNWLNKIKAILEETK